MIRKEGASPVPKLLGSDSELGNAIVGRRGSARTGSEAAGLLLAEIDGFRSRSYRTEGFSSGWLTDDPQDRGRRYLATNGGCVYEDLSHLELATPETLSATDHVASWIAMLRIAREAMSGANRKLPSGERIRVTVNNSDGFGHSYGSHLNVMVSRHCFETIFERRLHHMLYLASFLTSSVVFTGAGKVGSEDGAPAAVFQISQRADFIKTLSGPQTTHRRPVVNSRDESLCSEFTGRTGLGAQRARLHVIALDNPCQPMTAFLRAGTTQLCAAMIEQGEVPTELILDDPVGAVKTWSRDPTLRARAPLLTGRPITALELQESIRDRAVRFVAEGRAGGIVPDAERILEEWGVTLGLLRECDLPSLARRLDWAAKLVMLEGARARRGLSWDSPEMKVLDHLYSDLDPERGLFSSWEREGGVERVATEDRIRQLTTDPPEDTRAWLRAHLLRLARRKEVEAVDWYGLRLEIPTGDRHGGGFERWQVDLSDPLGGTRAMHEDAVRSAKDLRHLLRLLPGVARKVEYWGERDAPLLLAYAPQTARDLWGLEGGRHDGGT